MRHSIALITHKFPPGPGGMERWNYQMADSYAKAGARVTVIHFRSGHEPLENAIFRYIPVTVDPEDSPYNSSHFRYSFFCLLRIIGGFWRNLPVLKQHEFWQVTFGEPLLLKVFAYATAFLLRKPIIAVSGCVLFTHPYKTFWGAVSKKFLMRLMLRSSRLVLVDGTDLRSEFVQNGIRGKKIVVCHAGVDIEQFRKRESEADRDTLKRLGLDLDTGKKSVLYSCRLSHENSPLDYVHALRRVPSDKNLRGIVIGDGPMRDEMQQLAAESPHPISFHGSIEYEDLPAVLSNVDICLFPYSRYIGGISQMIPLAMACEAVVITTSIGDNAALVRHGENGFLVRPGDIGAMASLIEELLGASRHRIESIQKQARTTIERQWTIARREKEYGDLLSRFS